MLSKTLQLGAAGSGAAEGTYVEDVFSTQLYTGTGSNQTITNGVDLAGEGGLIWTKWRSGGAYTVESHALLDTERGATKLLQSDTTGAQSNVASYFNFNSDGYEITTSSSLVNHSSGGKYASWSFRKAPGFFDVVTYTSQSGVNQIAHNLGSVPGVIMIKKLNANASWTVYHRSTGATQRLELDGTGAAVTSDAFGNTAPTATHFYIGPANNNTFGNIGDTFVAYLFAHDEPIFGADADQSIVKCGSYTGAGSFPVEVNLGWEPQWVMVKAADWSAGWVMGDVMRGAPVGVNGQALFANTSGAEIVATDTVFEPTSTGFKIKANSGGPANQSGITYIYIAIRRGPMKVPEDATTVFASNTRTGNGGTATVSGIGFSPDSVWIKNRADFASAEHAWFDKLRGVNQKLGPDQTTQELNYAPNYLSEFGQDGFTVGSGSLVNYSAKTYADWMFRRAPGFFDVVAYTGTGSATTVNHNLGVEPELIIVKNRSGVRNWFVWVSGFGVTDYLELNLDGAKLTGANIWNSTAPTSTVFSVNGVNNTSSNNFITYLFASCPGVSKVGSYTGTGSNLSINCGFAGGARFVLIKRTDSTGDWWVFDTARGIVSSGIDPALRLNLTNPEVTSTDYLEPNSNGFTVTSTAGAGLNANGGSYIYLAIA